ncbi:MAG: hypothetical protein ACRYG2_10915 [Janthinobacterium lividum]
MRTYERVWWLVVLPLAVVGATEALLAVPLGEIMVGGILAAGLTGLGRLAWLSRPGARPGSTWVVVSAAGRGAVVGVVVAGLAEVLGGSAAVLLVMAVCLHPGVVTAAAAGVRRWLGPGTGAASASLAGHRPVRAAARLLPSQPVARASTRPGAGAPRTIPRAEAFTWPDAAAVRLLTTSQLCWGWRASFAALEATQAWVDHRRRTALVEVRQTYLDEIARRHPAGFARWLYAGARPASDPSRYLLADPGPTRPAPHSFEAGSTAPAEPAPTDREAPDA